MNFFVEALKDSIRACAHVLLNEACHLAPNYEIQDKVTKRGQLGKRPVGSSLKVKFSRPLSFLGKIMRIAEVARLLN